MVSKSPNTVISDHFVKLDEVIVVQVLQRVQYKLRVEFVTRWNRAVPNVRNVTEFYALF